MTFDEWYDQALISTDPKENMRMAWKAAQKVIAIPEGHRIVLTDAATKLLSDELPPPAVVEPRMYPKCGDIWSVRVRGGQIISQVYIDSADRTYVWVSDPGADMIRLAHKHGLPVNQRKHRIEDLEFLQLVVRDLK